MKSVNKCTLIGNVGAEPEIRATATGARIAKVSLATSRSWSDRSGQKREETEWHRLTFFGKLTDVVEQWVKKGDRLYVEGRIHYSQTESDQGPRYWTEIIVDELVMLGSEQGARGVQSGHRAEAATTSNAPAGRAASAPDDDLPF